MPEHGLVHLLELRKENLEIVEVQIDKDSPSVGQAVDAPRAARGVAADLRHARRHSPRSPRARPSCRPGDQVLAVLEPGKEEELRRVLLKK